MSNHLAISEQALGLILSGKQTLTSFSPEKFAGKYADIVKDLKNGKTLEEISTKYGTALLQTCKHAAMNVNGMGSDLDWAEMLNSSYNSELVEQDLSKALRYSQNVETDKLDELLRRIVSTRQSSQRLRSIRASEISDDYEPFLKSGSPAWDTHIGGIPTVGLVILGAKSYEGKTSSAISMMDFYLTAHPDREILFVTLEDMNEGWKHRAQVILGNRAEDFWSRCHIMEFAQSIDLVIEEASRLPKVSAIVLDYVDYLASDSSVSSYVEIYKKLSAGSKSLAVGNESRNMTIFALAQFGKTLYKGGVPTPNALPFAGLEYAYQLCMLYHADGDYYSDNDENPYTLPPEKGKGYLIFWKVKNARPHDPDFPGAIQVDWTAKRGYDFSKPGQWFSLANETKREIKVKRK